MRVLLLRGLLRESRHWGNFPQHLAEGLGIEESAVVCLDLPGIGTEEGRSFPLSIDKAMLDVRERWLALPEAKDEGLLFSVSLGSMIAAQWARTYPDDFSRGFVFTNTSVASLSGVQERISPEALTAFVKIMKSESETDREKLILRLVSNRCNADSSLLDRKASEWAKYAMDQKKMLILGTRQLFAASRFRLNSMNGSKAPVLCLTSLYDRLLSPAATMRVADFFDADQEIHHSAGHDLPLDDPDWVIQKLRSWLDLRSR